MQGASDDGKSVIPTRKNGEKFPSIFTLKIVET